MSRASYRNRGRVDGNQRTVMDALRKAGVSVRSLSAMADGIPDLLVGARGRNFLFELKDPARPASKRKLTDPEAAFLRTWQGQAQVAESAEEILKVVLA